MAEDLAASRQDAKGADAATDSTSAAGAGPAEMSGTAGDGQYEVRQGECITSIAATQGLFWETLWNDPGNMALRQKRGNPTLLLPGDRLVVPARRLKCEAGATEQRHVFRRRGIPAGIRVRVMRGDQPRSKIRYVLNVDGQVFDGTTDDQGYLQQSMPPEASQGRLFVGPELEEYVLQLGGLDPADTLSGAQQRLSNLGFECPTPQSGEDSAFQSAVAAFQTHYGMAVTGQIDQATRDRLVQEHGC